MPAAPAAETLLVTGANRGIGLELTRQALQRGLRVVATCRSPYAADALHALERAQPGAIQVAALDVTDAGSVSALAAALAGRTLDIVVNNAGVYGGAAQDLAETDFRAWAHTLDVNTLGPLRVTLALLPHLRRSKRPRVVTLSSEMGAFAADGGAAYAYRSSKAAVNKVMQVLARDLRAAGVVAVPVHPGWVRTDMGGREAPVSPEESARGLLDLIGRLTLRDSGHFHAWTGERLPW